MKTTNVGQSDTAYTPIEDKDHKNPPLRHLNNVEQSRVATYMSLVGSMMSTASVAFTAIPVVVALNHTTGICLWALKYLTNEALRTEVEEGENSWMLVAKQVGILGACVIGGIAGKKLGDRWQGRELQEQYSKLLGT